MNPKNNKNLDELITGAIGRDKPKFDFDKWKQKHKKEIEIFKSQENSTKTTSDTLKLNIWKVTLWRKVGYIAASILIISSLVANFVLSRKNADLRDELELARQDTSTAPIDDSVTINFYFKEHQDLISRQASLNSATEQSMQMLIDYDDIMYYEFLGDDPEFLNPGIIVRGPSTQQEISPSEAPAISNGHTLTLSEAQEAADFDLVSPLWLEPCYTLDQIRRIEGCDTMQLLYTDGINSVSLFEQPLDGQRGLSHQDFREYAVYRNKEQTRGTILAWRDGALSYVLIGNIELPQLMNMAQSISAGK